MMAMAGAAPKTDATASVEQASVTTLSKEAEVTFERVTQIVSNTSSGNDEWSLLRTRFSSLQNASKDVALEITTVVNRFKSLVPTVDAIESQEDSQNVVVELNHFLDGGYCQSAKTVAEAFLNLSRDLLSLFSETSSGDVKEQAQALAEQVNELSKIWSKSHEETVLFRESIEGAVTGGTSMRLKQGVKLAEQSANTLGQSLEPLSQGN